MVPTIVSPSVIGRSAGERSWFERVWTAVAVAAGAVFVVLAILESPPLPLLCLVLVLAGIGGVPFVRSPIGSARGRRQYAAGAAAIASAVLLAVGVGHHPTEGLAVAAILMASSPWTFRWISGL